jgi:2-iminoacetate synthase
MEEGGSRRIGPMFSTRYDAVLSELSRLSNHPVASARFEPYDPTIAQLLWAPELGHSTGLDQRILDAAAAAKREKFGGELFAIVPLYATSICRERCLYCNYRAANNGLKIDRVRLDDDELEREAQFLIDRGYRTIELVYASDPRVRVDAMCRHAELVHRLLDRVGGGLVALNAEPLETGDYRRLRGAGVDFSLVWMETYDRERYATLHPGVTPKTWFEYRLDCYERMIDGGIERVGMGVLSGLSDWRRDWAMLIHHQAYLRSVYGFGASVLGIPRLKPARGADLQTTPFVPSDREFQLAVAIQELFAPEVLPFVSTREEWDLCVAIASGGGCLFTFDCSTIPGGYALGRSGDQFPTASFEPRHFSQLLGEQGLDVSFQWSFEEAAALTRV